jgi:hypothetical protein
MTKEAAADNLQISEIGNKDAQGPDTSERTSKQAWVEDRVFMEYNKTIHIQSGSHKFHGLFVCLFSRVLQGRVTVYCRNYSHSHTVIYYRMLHVILISADTIARSFRFGPESTRGPTVATRHLVLSGPR